MALHKVGEAVLHLIGCGVARDFQVGKGILPPAVLARRPTIVPRDAGVDVLGARNDVDVEVGV
jgi:hypothetical protein